MILVKFFTRQIKRKYYLMADSSASKRSRPLWDTPEVLFEVDPGTSRYDWVSRAQSRIQEAHSNLVHVTTLFPPDGQNQVFDMLFKEEKKSFFGKSLT